MTLSDDDVKERKKMRNGSKVKNRKESTVLSEKEKKKKLNNDNNVKIRNDNQEKGELHKNCGNKVKNKVSFTLPDKEKERERLNKTKCDKKMHTDDNREKQKNISNGHNNAKSKKAFTASFENEKEREIKRLENPNTEKRMQSDDDEKEKKMRNFDSKVKNGKVSATLFEKKKKKMLSSDNVEKKRDTQFSSNKNKMQNNDTNKRIMPMTSIVKEKKLRPSKSVEMKMQSDGKQKKRNVSADVSKEKKMEILNVSNYKKRKREEPPSLFKKDKKIQADANEKNIHSVEMKKENTGGNSKEKKRKQPFAFFKCICNHFEEFLFIPPVAVSMLENFANHHVYLEDSEGKCSKIGLSVVDDCLAFHQGWSNFVSDHSINWGEFLLFEYTAKSTFSVRIFGRDSRERLTFNVESKRNGVGEKQPRGNRSLDDLLSSDGNSEDKDDEQCFSDEYPRCNEPEPQNETLKYHVTVNTKNDPKGVEFRLGRGPSVAPDKKDGNLINRQCKTKGTSPLRSKEYTMILISDSASSVHENEDTVNLTTSNADSAMHLVTINANESPKRFQRGVGNGASVVLNNKTGILPSGECRTKCVSPTHSKEKTRILINDAAPPTEENGDIVKLTTHTHRKEDKSMIVESDLEAAAPTKYLQLQDSDEDLILEQEINSVQFEPTTADQNNSKMTINENACRKHEAPGGFRCLEKWGKGIVTCRASFDGAELIKPENPQTTDGKLNGDYSAIQLNPVNKSCFSEGTRACVQPIFTMLDENSSSPDMVSKCEHSVADINHDINGKGTAVQLQTKMQQLAPVGSIVGSQRNNVCTLANYKVAGNYGAIGLNPVGSEGFCASVESTLTMPVDKPSSPDKISKFGCSRPDIDYKVEVKGTAVKPVTNTGHVESMGKLGSTVSNQSDSMPVCANHVVARQSEHFSKQEDIKSTSCVAPVDMLPVKTNILELDECSLLKINLQFCIPDTTQKWLELPKSLSNAVRQTRQDRNVIMLKDAMKRLWPVFYHENAVFVGFTAGWQHFVAANDLQAGDLCELLEEPDEEEPVYSFRITKK